jgi:predicted ABC-type ATPase
MIETDSFAATAKIDRLLVILAGPNGSGKTTFFEYYLAPLGLRFVNADLIARSLADSPAPETVAYAAAQIADAERHLLLAEGQSFCMETVFSDRNQEKLSFLRQAINQGYTILLVFICLEFPELNIARVSQRVTDGGHDVPDEKIVSRYPRSIDNLKSALPLADLALLLDNSCVTEPYRFVALLHHGKIAQITDTLPNWAAFLIEADPMN